VLCASSDPGPISDANAPVYDTDAAIALSLSISISTRNRAANSDIAPRVRVRGCGTAPRSAQKWIFMESHLRHKARSSGRRARHVCWIRSVAVLVVLAALASGAACSTSGSSGGEPSERAPAAPRAPAAQAQVSAPFDLGGVMKQVHFAYRPEGAGWIGGHQTYEVRASAAGFGFTPVAAATIMQAPAAFETTSFTRGDERRAASQGVGRVEPDGHLAIQRGEVIEHLRNDEDGVEQSFELAQRPAGSGDFVVSVRVSGEVYAGQTAGGHHFTDAATGLGVRYGVATWVDASGERTPLAVRWTGEELAITVPEATLEGAVYPAVIDPTVSSEIAIDAPLQQAAPLAQITPAVAFDGSNYLVVWNDQRLANGTTIVEAARVTAAGALLDPGGIFISSKQVVSGMQPKVDYDGTNFFVVWNGNTQVFGARIAPTGVVLDPSGILLCDLTSSLDTPSQPSVAHDGLNFLVVWADDRNSGYGIYFNRVSAAGTVLDGLVGKTVSLSSKLVSAPAVMFDGTGYFVVWQDYRSGFSYDIYGARVTKAGAVLDASGIAISTAANDQVTPSIAFDGTNYLVVWNDGRWGTADIFGARVSKAGAVLDAAGIGITSMIPNAQTTPSVAFDGSNYEVVWADSRSGNPDIYGARVTTGGVVVDANGFVISAGAPAAEQAPAVTCSAGGACFAVWQDQRAGTSDIYGARFSGAAVNDLQGLQISSAANDESNASVAFDGTNYFIVWQDRRAVSSWDVYGARVSADGTVLDPSGLVVSAANADQITPRVTWLSPNYVVVWEDKRADLGDIYGARVDASGAVLDPSGFVIAAGANEQKLPAIATDGTGFFTAWVGVSSKVSGARVSSAGTVLDPAGISLFTSTSATSAPAIAWDGVRYLVVMAVSSSGGIRGARFTPAGAALDGTNGFSISSSGTMPQVAFDGLNFFTVFEKSSGVFGARVNGAAMVLDPNGLPISPFSLGARITPAIACDGTTCLVAWSDFRSTTNHAIFGSFVDQAGTVFSPNGFGISTIISDHAAPAVVSDLSGHALVAYQRTDFASPFGAARMRARLITSKAQGQGCSAAGDCASGFCVDGVCCNTACGGNLAGDCSACSVAAGASADGICAALTGSICNDANACTPTDTCQAGTCVGTGAVTCSALDACHVAGTCNPATGVCSNPNKANGAACNDANACTQSDTCVAGSCTGTNPVVCPDVDGCHQVAACDPATGQCAVTPMPDGTACNDGDACTKTDSCQAGACVGANPVICTAKDQCHNAGKCSPSTGQCTAPLKPNGSICNDGDACTGPDLCQSGVCTSKSAVDCVAEDDCHLVGTCFPQTGVCSSPKKKDGSFCPGGTCTKGVCQVEGTTSSAASTTASSSSSSSGSGSGGAGGSEPTGAGGSAATTTATASSSTGEPSPESSGGCGCRVAEDRSALVGGAPGFGLALILLARRRRAARPATKSLQR
jgi:hypothetical protein